MRDRKHFSPQRDRAWGGRAAAVLPMCYSGGIVASVARSVLSGAFRYF